MDQFKGLGVAMVTPFKADGAIDYTSLEKLVHHLADNGCNYLVVQGTTGEVVTLTEEEKVNVLDFVAEVNNGRLPIVLGVGGNDTRKVIAAFKQFDFSKVAGILSVSPAYNKPTQEGIYQHYKAIAAQAPAPIILYNVPARTSSNMTAETTLRLARDFGNIVAMKEASGNLDQIGNIIRNKPADFLVLSGDDGLTVPMLALGADGLISVAGNAWPAEWAQLVSAGLNNDLHAAAAMHHRFAAMVELLFKEGNPAGVKAALSTRGICQAHVRLPLVPASGQLAAAIATAAGQLVPSSAPASL